jgi:hypothetical protein
MVPQARDAALDVLLGRVPGQIAGRRTAQAGKDGSMSELARTGYDPDEAAYNRMMREARVLANVPGLRPEIQGKTDAIAAIMISLQGWGLPITLPGVNMAFDWIEGQATPTTQLYQALARRAGYQLVPVVRTAERAVARIVGNPEGPVEIEFTLDDAIRAGRLNEWVDLWRKEDGKWHKDATWVVRINGEPTEGDLPGWAKEQVDKGRVKRFDAWWNYRTDMLWKSAAKRAIKLACPHVLLGGAAPLQEFDHGFAQVPAQAWPPQVARPPAPAAVPAAPPPAYGPDDPERPFE